MPRARTSPTRSSPKARTKPAARPRRGSVEKKLAPYRKKRDFGVTSEPSGEAAPPPGQRFVVQRHRARALHYDVRLELDGVLVSWAVPKGPTLDPKARRMAVHVEDHPLAYYDFEGRIPEGEYGAGDVVVWDWGTWSPAEGEDPAAALAKGDLHVDLHGRKLEGRFVFVRRDDKQGSREQWLLIKKADEHAVAGWDPEEHPTSVKSGRTNDEVAAAPAATWVSGQSWAGPTADELAALDDLGKGGDWGWAAGRSG
jgi:bifunctional non-homologous end joining protein LigD